LSRNNTAIGSQSFWSVKRLLSTVIGVRKHFSATTAEFNANVYKSDQNTLPPKADTGTTQVFPLAAVKRTAHRSAQMLSGQLLEISNHVPWESSWRQRARQ
jgi:hypothetical protein